jgi:hypothetical protein
VEYCTCPEFRQGVELPVKEGTGGKVTVTDFWDGVMVEQPWVLVYDTPTCCNPPEFQVTTMELLVLPDVIVPPGDMVHK